ncbi:hypothetical protein DK419_05815 [Methylobacterium terrae]|uniref:Transposase IS701-like DDE domain-containing protein n=1 Tax=Methylobacterium terrae TaxID=2202827 RepID=A0A2U8WI30_9HYPH|nr:hypothetical protein DK419_05815 [Methylobacterium terrae]
MPTSSCVLRRAGEPRWMSSGRRRGWTTWRHGWLRFWPPCLAPNSAAGRRSTCAACTWPGERESMEPMAARVAPGHVQQLHHFVSASPWSCARLERVLAGQADRLVGGPQAVLVVDDAALVKQGRHSVGAQRQCCNLTDFYCYSVIFTAQPMSASANDAQSPISSAIRSAPAAGERSPAATLRSASAVVLRTSALPVRRWCRRSWTSAHIHFTSCSRRFAPISPVAVSLRR